MAWFLRNLHRFDTVHVRTHADWYFTSYLLTKLARRRLVISATLDDSLPGLTRRYRPRLRGLARRAFGLFDAYVSISPKLQAENLAAGTDPARCHLIPCGITVPTSPPGRRARMREAIGAGPDNPVLLFVGGLCARKDPLFLVEAMPQVRAAHPGARLVLVGPPLEPDYVATLRDRIAALGLGHSVLLAGEQLDPHPYFDAADMLVFASRLEGFGTVVPEAMAHGLPVAVRHLPGVNDSFVIHGETGFLFDDAAGYLEAVRRLAGDPALRRRLGNAGRALANREFGMRGVAARYLGIYGFAEPVVKPVESEAQSELGCTASILDARFHRPAPVHADGPVLLTMVDAEEAFDWSRPFSRDANDVRSMRSQHLAHRVFERHGVRPTYLVDYPVAVQGDGRAPLRELLADGLCDVGAQMHPWVTPPFLEEVTNRNSFAGNLPTLLELEKARRLTGTLGDVFGAAPQIYRTGRFGAGVRTGDILKRLGYAADSSVAPYWPPDNLRHIPSAWALSSRPYWIDRDRTLMEIPTSAALVGRLAQPHGARLARAVFHPWAERLNIPGGMSRLGLLERIRLSPEGMTVEEAKRLTRMMLAEGHRVFVLTYHSPSLEPGNTPYVRDAGQLRQFLGWLEEYYGFFGEELGGHCGTWRDVRFGAEAAPERTPALIAAGG
ncbi:MAG: glycosyltransferase [Acetobacteraceae bacterium]|nr:glycosyltransferase [Acetobacteraceae bacterium]